MRVVTVMVVCGLCGLCACGRTARNTDGPMPDAVTGSGGTASSTSEPFPPGDCAPIILPLDEESPLGPTGHDLLDKAAGTHVLAAEYGAVVVDGLGDTELEVAITPIPAEGGGALQLVYQPCLRKIEIPVQVELVTSDRVVDASSAAGVIGYDDDGGYVHVRTELRGARPWSQVAFTPSSEVSPELGAPRLEWVDRQVADLEAAFGASEEFPDEVSGTFDTLRWPIDCYHAPESHRAMYEQTEVALASSFDTLERSLPLALNWQDGASTELDLRIAPNAPVCESQEQAVEVSATSSDGRVAAAWHARAYDRDFTWITLDAVVSDLDALEERLGVYLEPPREYAAYGLRFSLRWHADARAHPVGMLQVLGIDLEACGGDGDTCAEATELAVATIGKLGATVSTEVLSRDLTGDHGTCPNSTVLVSGVGSPLVEGVIDEEPASLNVAAVDQCNGGAPRIAFDWHAADTGRFRFDTQGSSYDTVLALRPLTATDQCASLTGDACNDDTGDGLTSEVTTTLSRGQGVRVEIASYGGVVQPAGGTPVYRLNVAAVE